MEISVDWLNEGCVLVGEAGNGQKGLALIEEKQPDIVITDLTMLICRSWIYLP